MHRRIGPASVYRLRSRAPQAGAGAAAPEEEHYLPSEPEIPTTSETVCEP
jgi:hypothetical protein